MDNFILIGSPVLLATLERGAIVRSDTYRCWRSEDHSVASDRSPPQSFRDEIEFVAAVNDRILLIHYSSICRLTISRH